jgi:hypothetical protein
MTITRVDKEVRISDRGRKIAVAREYIDAFLEAGKITGNNNPELVILDCMLFKLDSPLDFLLNIRPLLASRAQILIVEENPRSLLALKRMVNHGIWQGAESPFDIRDKQLLTTRELVQLLTMSGYRVRSGQYNIDSRLQRIYGEEVIKNNAEVTIGKITLRHLTKDELTELCSNFVLLDVSLAQ